ncbi:MAG: hypothetical protein KIT31_25635 [Deltaproteobacteria bacterium]|nr:hypothetical protein [Deltaproteobacteria bacterium]
MSDAPKPFMVARLAGTQAQMGAQHGALVADDAARLIDFYRTMPERVLAGGAGGLTRTIVRGVANAWQARLAKERPPELAERTRAFVDAAIAASGVAGVDRRAARHAFATMDSLQNCVSVVARAKLGPFANPFRDRATPAAVPACSTLIAWGRATEDGELVFGRNFDFPGVGVWDAAPAFVVCAPDGGQHYGFFTTRGADTPVVTVVNEAGLVFAPHTRWHRDVTWGGAMIVDVVHDLARRAETIEDAIRIARERPASSSWGVAVGSAREKAGVVIEFAGPHVDVVRAAAGADHVICNNRYRGDALQAGQVAASAAWSMHSDRREQRLRQLFAQRTAPLSPRDVARFLGDRRDPTAPERERRLGGILAQPTNVHCVVVRPAALRAWVGVDRAPVCEGAWAEVAWTWTGPTGKWELGDASAVGASGARMVGDDGAAVGARMVGDSGATVGAKTVGENGAAVGASGFGAAIAADFVRPHDPATLHVRAAVRAFEHDHDLPKARAAMERAIAAAPEDPSLRLGAVWLALEEGRAEVAVAHAQAGLETETEPYRRGQLLLWGARAAHGNDPALVARWSAELESLRGPGVEELVARGLSQRETTRRGRATSRLTAALRGNGRKTPRVHTNLLMVDAY